MQSSINTEEANANTVQRYPKENIV